MASGTPFSDKLEEDSDLEMVNEEKILLAIKSELTKNRKVLEGPVYPDACTLVKFASSVYREETKALSSDFPDGWKLLTTGKNKKQLKNEYYGAAYWNAQLQLVVIAHRGTSLTSVGSIWTDIAGVMQNNYCPQVKSSVTFAGKISKILEKINEEENVNIQLSFTGHSLGGWLAQITTFSTKYLSCQLHNGGWYYLKRKELGFHAHTVVFESPGAETILRKMRKEFHIRYGPERLSLSYLDITCYLSLPNAINTCNAHLGTLYQITNTNRKLGDIYKWWDVGFYTLTVHKLETLMSDLLSLNQHGNKEVELKQVLDWPLVEKTLKKRLDDVSKFFSNFLPWRYAKIEPNEYHEYLKVAKENGTDGDLPDIYPVRYRLLRALDSSCSLSMFSESELDLLMEYERTVTNPRCEQLINRLFDRKTAFKVNELLKSFKINNKERLVCTDSKNLLEKLIRFIKNTNRFFPDILKDLRDIGKATWFDLSQPTYPIRLRGRSGSLEKLQRYFSQPTTVVISGNGGIGKSALALQFAKHFATVSDHNAIWIDTGTPFRVYNSFYRLMSALKLDSHDDGGQVKNVRKLAAEVYSCFVGSKTLIIFDDAANPACVEAVMPNDDFNVIITTKNKNFFQNEYNEIELEPLAENTASELIESGLGTADILLREKIKKLVSKMEKVPLVLQKTVTYITCNSTQSYSEAIEMLISASTTNKKGIDNILGHIIESAIQRMEKEIIGRLALLILYCTVFFASGNIPISIVKLAFEADVNVNSAIEILMKEKLINVEHELFVVVPGPIQEVLKNVLQPEQVGWTKEKLLKKLLSTIQSIITSGDTYVSLNQYLVSIWEYVLREGNRKELIDEYIVKGCQEKGKPNQFLHLAGSNCYELLKSIIEQINDTDRQIIIKSKDDKRRTAMHYAASSGDLLIVRLLLENGANVNAKKMHGWTPLHLAVANGHYKVVNELLRKNALVSAVTGYKFTPLHLAATEGYVDIVRELMSHSEISLNAATGFNFTALHLAASKNHTEVCKTLLDTNLYGDVNVIPVYVNAKTNDQSQALHFAAKNGNFELVQVLLDSGDAEIDAVDKGGFTALHSATYSGHAPVFHLLLERKANVNLQTTNLNTALHFAVQKDNHEFILALLKRNCDKSLQDATGATAEDCASEFVRLFLRYYPTT